MNILLPRSLLLGCALALGLSTATAQSSAPDDELDALLELLAEETELATRSKQNADYVPGIVNVLHADEARLLGARSALDALALVPGLEVNRDQYGAATIRVRGVDFFFNGGNIKVLVDGLPISRESAFQSSAILLMPIEQIERIELIRGPGSGVHGDFAYMGLVNLVTRHSGNAVALGLGAGDRESISGHFEHHNEAQGLRLSGNVSQWQSDRYETSDSLDNDEQRRYLNLQFGWRELSVKLVGIDRDYTGVINNVSRPGSPPPPNPTRINRQEERSYNTELRYDWRSDSENRAALWLQRQQSEYNRTVAAFEGPRTELGGDLLRRVGRHLLLAQLQWTRLDIDRGVIARPGQPLQPISDSRDMRSLTVQDQIDLGEQLQLTAGLRFDDLQGVDSDWTPRIAALWQISDRHLLKAQYAEGFRSPTYLEAFDGGSPIGERPFERVATQELGYVYRHSNTVFRATAFVSRISDMLFPINTPNAALDLGIESRGVEFELIHQFHPDVKLQASWSTANTDDERTSAPNPQGGPPLRVGGPSLSQPEQLGNLALLIGQNRPWSAGIHWQHVGRRADQGIAGLREGYDLLNLGLSYRPPRWPQLRLDFGLRNALEDEVIYFESQPPNTVLRLRYPERVWHAGLSWSFD